MHKSQVYHHYPGRKNPAPSSVHRNNLGDETSFVNNTNNAQINLDGLGRHAWYYIYISRSQQQYKPYVRSAVYEESLDQQYMKNDHSSSDSIFIRVARISSINPKLDQQYNE